MGFLGELPWHEIASAVVGVLLGWWGKKKKDNRDQSRRQGL